MQNIFNSLKRNAATFALLAAIRISFLSVSFAAPECRQFRAAGIGGDGWCDVSGAVKMSAVHSPSNGWVLAGVSKTPSPSGGAEFGVSAGGTPSPYGFDAGETGTVSVAYFVILAEGVPPLATLVSSPGAPCRLLPDSELSFFGASSETSRDFQTQFMGGSNSTSVNNGDAPLTADSKTKLVVCRWDAPVEISRVFVGGHAANWRWRRSFDGSILEFILADGISEHEDLCIRRYISAAYGIGKISEPAEDLVGTLNRLGINDFVLFGSVITVR